MVDKYKIETIDIWNMDETSLRIGIGHGQWVIVPIGQEQGHFKNLIGSLVCNPLYSPLPLS